jgi:hypothetical protein
MAESTQKSTARASTSEAPKTAAEANAEELEANQARNPVDLGTNVDELPAVPGAGQFMDAEDATEETTPAATPDTSKKG